MANCVNYEKCCQIFFIFNPNVTQWRGHWSVAATTGNLRVLVRYSLHSWCKVKLNQNWKIIEKIKQNVQKRK